ncbi:MAG: hypothetical protein ACRBFS_00990 [Aureispira sp.]
MGSTLEINDTLLLTAAQGFPTEILDLKQHQQAAIPIEAVQGQVFSFVKSGVRVLHKDPVRQFLVQKIQGKWLFWGHALIQSYTIEKKLEEQGRWDSNSWLTKGSYVISKIYDPVYQKLTTNYEAPAGCSYFEVLE